MGKAKQTFKTYMHILLIVFAVVAPMLVIATVSAAPTYTSPNYGVDEVFMGAGGLNDASSANYRARASLGDTAVGNTSSTNYQAYGGFTTTTEPFLEFIVNQATVDVGLLTTTTTKTGSATFTVRTYLASGYVVYTASDPPKNGTYAMATPSSPTASAQGTEQFGINLVDNSSPNIGADPVQIPDATYSYGQAANDYDTPDVFKYTKGDVVAYSNKSSGTTQFTISYLFNISDITPGGIYKMEHNLVATSTF